MTRVDKPLHDDAPTSDYAIATSRATAPTAPTGGTPEHDAATEHEAGAAESGPAVTLAARVTCPDCGAVSKLDWMEKAPRGSGYVSTVLCESCGCFVAVLVGRVSTRVIAHQQDY
jgi:phage terminase large subunit GpA-like protein